MTSRNILFIMSDEHQAQAMSCAGHPLVKTPNMDALAARGVRFTNAYTPSPICVPARASIATGLYAHQTGYWDNALAYDGRVKGWGHALHGEGVGVVSIGKLHYRNDSDPTGFDEQIVPMHIMDGVGQIWGSVRNPLPNIQKVPKWLNDVGAGLSKYNKYDMLIADRCEQWLAARQPDSAPWLLFASFVAPHFPLVVPEEYLKMYDPADMPLPELREKNGYKAHPWAERMRDFSDVDSVFGDDDDRRRLAIASYFSLCTFVDAQIGRVIAALDKAGLTDSTTIVYTSDHGETLGMRDRWGKSVLYGESTRVPMIVAGPGLPEGKVSNTAVNLLDLPPAFMENFGLVKPSDWPGGNLFELAKQEDDRERTVFSEYHAATSPSGGFMVANADWKYHYYAGYAPELFDLANDPQEARNLIDEPGYAGRAEDMYKRLLAVCDPDAVDAAAKADQDRLVEQWGGPEAAINAGTPGETPPPVA
ncbi:MAG: sulfatase-like hydrolase/transferase [Beijerinckiaceae bacterium]